MPVGPLVGEHEEDLPEGAPLQANSEAHKHTLVRLGSECWSHKVGRDAFALGGAKEDGVDAQAAGEYGDDGEPEGPGVPREDADQGRQLAAKVGRGLVDEDLVPGSHSKTSDRLGQDWAHS